MALELTAIYAQKHVKPIIETLDIEDIRVIGENNKLLTELKYPSQKKVEAVALGSMPVAGS